MGFLSSALVQVVITSVILGALKRAGIVRVDSQAIENPGARQVFSAAVNFGEAIALKGEHLVKEFQRK